MLYMKTEKRNKSVIPYTRYIQNNGILFIAYLYFLCNLLHEYVWSYKDDI